MSKALNWTALAWIALRTATSLSAASAMTTSPPGQQPTVIAITQGKLAGATDAHGIRSFKGIPYAKPPVGPQRWKAPVAAGSWSGVRDATSFGGRGRARAGAGGRGGGGR